MIYSSKNVENYAAKIIERKQFHHAVLLLSLTLDVEGQSLISALI